MKALVTTPNFLLLVDLLDRTTKVLESDRREYYGISWWENNDSLVLGHSGVVNDSLRSLEDYARSEKGYLSFGENKSTAFLSAPHQILCAPNKMIITTNTGRNCVTLYNVENGFYKDIRINDIRWDRLGNDSHDGEHFNSVYLKNDRLYVLAHGLKKTSYVLEYSYPDCELLKNYPVKLKSGLHNVWVDDLENIFVCHTESGELIEVKSNETVWSNGDAFYSRGLAVTSDFILIGDSAVTSRSSRTSSPTSFWLIDRKTLRTVDLFMAGDYGGIHEIRIIDIPDEAHHGNVFSGADRIESYYLEKSEFQRQYKLNLAKRSQISNKTSTIFNSIINGFVNKEDGWISPKDENFSLATLKNTPVNNFKLSTEYLFSKSDKIDQQHLSFIFGYQGSQDTNMIAVLLAHHSQLELTSLSIWKNSNAVWKCKETLLSSVPHQGKLSVLREGNKIKINCNNADTIYKIFDKTELKGDVGIRCLGSQFRDFSLNDF